MKIKSENIKVLLYPFSLIYGLIVSIRNLLFNLNILSSKEFNIPVISVGNITVGGTGKTPHIEYLISLLQNDFKVATLSRGYKRKSHGFVLATEKDTANTIGDEPIQIKRKFPHISVAVDRKRVNGVNNLLLSPQGNELDVILLDDAFQHRYIKPGLSILLMDYNRPITEDHILPYGRLRESPHEMSRAHIIIVTKSPAKINPIQRRILVKNLHLRPYQSLYFTTLKYGNIKAVFPSNAVDMVNQEWGKENFSILLVTGIANPAPLREYLNNFSNNIQEIIFPDHHAFSKEDLKKIHTKFEKITSPYKIIITTEKDSVRFSDMQITDPIIRSRMFYIPLLIKFLQDDKARFNDQIMSYVNKNKRTSSLHKGHQTL